MSNNRTVKVVNGGLMLALGMVLPFMTGQIPAIGSRLLPMHIPALLTGYISGPLYGLLVGFIMPLLRTSIWGMPPMPQAIAMAFELGTYGFLAGLLYAGIKNKPMKIFGSLIGAMIGGRIVWGLASYILYGIAGSEFPMKLFFAGAFINALPGIIIQLILIPVLIYALEKGKILR